MDLKNRDEENGVATEVILAFAIMGGICVCLLFSTIWGSDGIITSWFSWQRLLTVLCATVFGGAIGWMIYPRVPFAWAFKPGGITNYVNDFKKTHPESLTWMRRKEGEKP